MSPVRLVMRTGPVLAVAVMAAVAVPRHAVLAAPRHAQACPPNDRHPLRNRTLAGRFALAPGRPNALLLCRYRGVGPHHANELIASRLVRRRFTVDRVRRAFNELPPFPPGSFSCPGGNRGGIIALFRYQTGPDAPVDVELDGCRAVTNGPRHRWALTPPGPRLPRTLVALLRR